MDQFINEEQINFYDMLRPKYSQDIFKDIVSKTSGHEDYLDIACGTGQLLIPLSNNFKNSIGLDVSAAQIQKAKENIEKLENHLNKTKIHLLVSDVYDLNTKLIQDKITESDFSENSSKIFDLITIGQAFHWFDELKLLNYLKTILKEDGTLILAGYKKQHFSKEEQPELYEMFQDFLDKLIPYFECDVDNNDKAYYKSMNNIKSVFELKNIQTKFYSESFDLNLRSLIDLVKSFSAYINYRKKNNNDEVLDDLKKDLMKYFKVEDEKSLMDVKIKYYNFYFVVFIS